MYACCNIIGVYSSGVASGCLCITVVADFIYTFIFFSVPSIAAVIVVFSFFFSFSCEFRTLLLLFCLYLISCFAIAFVTTANMADR